jgi:hypothetical protein
LRPVDQHEDTVLGAMRQVALAGGPLTEADRASLLAAGRYLLRRPDVTDCAALPAVTPADLATTIKDKELKAEAVKYLTVMALVDGSLDKKEEGGAGAGILARARCRGRLSHRDRRGGVRPPRLVAGGHDPPEHGEHHRSSLAKESRCHAVVSALRGRPGGARAGGTLRGAGQVVGRHLRQGAVGGKALWAFYKTNGYAFPGEPAALNERFGTLHGSTHVISGYDTSARGEILVSTFTAAVHPINAIAGHILPVIFSWHLDIKINDVARSTSGGLDPDADPDAFWPAWARGHEIRTDIFGPEWQVWSWVERDLEELRATLDVSPAGSPPA